MRAVKQVHPPAQDSKFLRVFPFYVLLAAITVFCFWYVTKCGFLNFDDADYVTENPHVLTGLSWSNLRWAFTTNYVGNWHPLTWISLQTINQFFGLNPAAYHGVNLGMHVINSLLLFAVFFLMTEKIKESFWIAAIFAVHPMHIESVAWVVEVKDVLSTLFVFLAMLSYVRYVKRPQKTPYFFSLLFFSLSLMAKQMYVTLPFVLVLLDFWPLKRINSLKKYGPLVYEKIPFVLLTLLASALTLWAQHTHSFKLVPLYARIQNAAFTYLEYMRLFLWPDKVSAIYPFIIRDFSAGKIILGILPLALLTVWFLKLCKNKPYLLAGWILYLGSLIPVIGLCQVGSQSMAARYTYFPYIGLSMMLVFGLEDFFTRKKILKDASVWVMAVMIAGFGARTLQEVKYWESSVTLFERADSLIERNSEASYLAGLAHYKKREYTEAEKYLKKALVYLPDLTNAYRALSSIYMEQKDFEKAEETLVKGLPDHPDEAYYNLGVLALSMRRVSQGRAYFEKALSFNSRAAGALSGLSRALLKTCEIEKAVDSANQALTIDPNQTEAKESLAWVQGLGDTVEKQTEHCKISQVVEMLKPISNISKISKQVHDMKRIPRVSH